MTVARQSATPDPRDDHSAFVDALAERVDRLESQVETLLMAELNRRSFTFDGANYSYIARRPNRTWTNERAVELPIVWAEVQRAASADEVLEVGNVLSAYYPVRHRVLDKYERHPKVTWNEDIVDFEPPFAPSLIVSISTLEHVGHSETPRDAKKFRLAVDCLISWLAPGGKLLLTVPLGYNPAVLEYLQNPSAAVRSVACLKRISADNTWQQTSVQAVASCAYGRPFPCANAIAVICAAAPEEAE